MLESLTVSNFAIIEDIKVEFNSKMTVLTGETGAGKSLLIDTISLLLGSRADSDMIRYNETHASITGVFSMTDEVLELLDKYQIPKLDKVIIHREVWNNSKNVIKINNTSVNLVILKQITSLLADLHIQNDTIKLFDKENYLSLIDPKNDNKFDSLINDYSINLFNYKKSLSKYNKILEGQKNTLEKLEFLEYEKNELESLNLYPNIDVELEDRINKLSNYDKIFTSLNKTIEAIDGNTSALDNIYNASCLLNNISSYDNLYLESSEKLKDFYYQISEIKDSLSHQLKDFDYDEGELNSLIDSLNEINKVKEKYKKNVIELIEELKEITLEIDLATNYDEVLKDTYNEVVSNYNKLVTSSKNLTIYRKNICKNIEKIIKQECLDLDLENTKFEIQFKEIEYNNPLSDIFLDNGCDDITFMISFNKGEPLKPLYKVASGGEMSRIMLAFKSFLSKNSNISLMVFDEIDTGVSGATAKKIALKMHEISTHTQVLCITHLPQVASIGDYHKHIYKVEENKRTKTLVKDLIGDERIEEIALMLSGDKLSLYALEHAKSLLEEIKK